MKIAALTYSCRRNRARTTSFRAVAGGADRRQRPRAVSNNPAGRNRAASGTGLSASLRAPPAAPPRGRGAAPQGQLCPARAPPAAPPGQRLRLRACGGASPQGNRRRGARTGARVQACTGGGRARSRDACTGARVRTARPAPPDPSLHLDPDVAVGAQGGVVEAGGGVLPHHPAEGLTRPPADAP